MYYNLDIYYSYVYITSRWSVVKTSPAMDKLTEIMALYMPQPVIDIEPPTSQSVTCIVDGSSFIHNFMNHTLFYEFRIALRG